MTKGAEDRGLLLLPSKKVHVGSPLTIHLNMPFSCILVLLLSLLCLLQVDVTEAFSAGGGKHKKSPQTQSKQRKPQQHDRPTVPRPIIPFDSFSHLSALKDGIEILPASGKGMGAFTTSAIAKGSTVGEYTGEFLTQRDVEARYWDQRKVNKHDRKWRNSRRRRNQGLSGDYLFDMGNGSFIDGEDADVSSWCRFANHASPNNDDDDGGGDNDDPGADHADFKCNVEVRARSRSSNTGTFSSAISKPQIPTSATTEMEISALPSKARKGREGAVNGGTLVHEKEEELHLYFVALRDIEVGTEICYDYGIDYWDVKYNNPK